MPNSEFKAFGKDQEAPTRARFQSFKKKSFLDEVSEYISKEEESPVKKALGTQGTDIS